MAEMTPYDAEGLWTKAKLHLNRSYAALDRVEFEESALWAASALELLAKAALAKVNPLLIADPVDDGRSLLIASGLSSDFARFKSVPAKALFSRCARAFRPFSETEASLVASQRNEELHSALAPFASVDEDQWWQRYWAQAVILVHAQDRTIVDLVGHKRDGTVEAHLARNKENIARRVQAMTERAQRRWERAASSEDARQEILALLGRATGDGEFHSHLHCPVCGELGDAYGDNALWSDVEYDGEDGSAIERFEVATEHFECSGCALRLAGAEYVIAAGMDETFETQREYEPEWDDYGND